MPDKVVVSMCQCSMTLPNRQVYGTSWKTALLPTRFGQAKHKSGYPFILSFK